MSPAEPKEPRTEAGKALMESMNDHDWLDLAGSERLPAILAIEDQAATEARRELLEEIEGLRRELQRCEEGPYG